MFSIDTWNVPGAAIETRVSKLDGTVKLLFRFSDGAPAESVVLFNKGRASACLSSQSGCACGCGFCATGALGFRRDLTAGEILGQFAACRAAAGGALQSIVFMGMGEPFLNWENVKKSILELSDQKKSNLPQSRMTVSTVGINPGIRALAESGLKVNLAVSIVTADERQRARLVPMSGKYPLSSVIDESRDYCERSGRAVFFEYILFGGLNDAPADAEKLVALVSGVNCKINLIRYNPSGKTGFSPAGMDKGKEFQKILMAAGLRSYLRREKGADIAAACGQLADGGLYKDRL